MRFSVIVATFALSGCASLFPPPKEYHDPYEGIAKQNEEFQARQVHETAVKRAEAEQAPKPANEARAVAREQRVTDHCAATRDERVADYQDAAKQWLEDSAAIEKAGGLKWYSDHCQRGVDQYGNLMPAVCNAKIPRGATQKTVEIALDRIIDLNAMNPNLAPTQLNSECAPSDSANGGALLIKKTDTESIKRFAASKINPRPAPVDVSQMVGE